MQLRLMDRLATVTVAVFVCLLAAVRTETRIRGCNDIEDLQNEAANFTEFCFCKANVLTKTVALFCTYGSDSLQLVNALDAINVSDFTLTQLSISHLKWENSQLSKKLALKMGSKLEEIVVGQCGSHGLSIDVDAFDHLSDSLSTLSVYDCGLKSIPDAVKPLSAIRKLSFPDNLINSINAAPLKNKKNLIYLNLEGNFINHAEEDAFEGVDSLRTLLIGEHNYANETLLGEIQKLRGLEILDMTKMDGVVSIEVRQFKGNENLQTLILNGCSLKSIGNESFAGLRNLKQMDLRLNLLETVANESFVDAEKLERLSLEGNFLKTINASMWNGLKRLETLDLGWNELVNLTSGAFAPIGKALKNLKLSNNAKLSLIEGNAFESLMELRVLNVSSCRVREITATHLRPLAALDTLDLSHNELLRIGPEAFKEQRKTLKVLKLNDNLLRGFDGAIVDSLEELESIDLSDNPWLCDKQIYSLISAIENKYKLAFEEKKDFLLENANNTFCSRPYKLRFKSLFELLEEELEEYNEKMDTTTPPTTTATSNETEGTVETTPIFDLALLVGDTSSNKSILREDIRKMPEFDINERWADDFKSESERTWIQFAMVGSIVLITVAILATVVLHLKVREH
ncbi:hypothetical protein L596_008063 [Steinernema carpocapsae]|uniref:LRRCT domain-containing protein n=1 Tax=Steinernema carpocapsae TaxID=34508 RepID=A0A4U5PBA9_STECR|nr:hypothetical protein L596_008063 [Steinernema carpocapsae]